MKTPIQTLERQLDGLIELAEQEGGLDALIIKECMQAVKRIIADEHLHEKEKQMIIDAVRHGDTTIGYAEQYYNEKFKQ